jgi:sulfur relay (sulfurtransferase) complex TusBCD TusD component (DsrE family)
MGEPTDNKPAVSELAGKKLGVLLTTPPQHSNFGPAVALMNAALDGGVRVYLYCIDDGVRSAGTPEVQAIKARGASLFGCAYGAGRRSMVLDDSATWSGLTVLADVVGSTDKFVSF